MTLKTIKTDSPEFGDIIKYAIAPRPICFASTINRKGEVNLSPFSYFNLFSHHPAVCVFSPVRRMRDNSTKHTLANVQEVPEVVINIVNYDIVQQQSLASTEYDKGVNEFAKAGLTQIASEMIRPPRVKESPVQFECNVKEIISLGNEAGNGSLVLAEVVLMHISEHVFDHSGKINQAKLDLVARLGADWYCRVTDANLFEVAKPLRSKGIGVDALPFHIRNSKILTGNDLGRLGNIENLPTSSEILDMMDVEEVKDILDSTIGDASNRERELHTLSHRFLMDNQVYSALKVLMLD